MPNERTPPAKILIIAAEPAQVAFLTELLQEVNGFRVTTTADPGLALPLYLATGPDLVILALHLPGVDGLALLHELRTLPDPGARLPILLIIEAADRDMRWRALSTGANDFLPIPFDPLDVILRVGNLLEARFIYARLQEQTAVLTEQLRESMRSMEDARIALLNRLALDVESRDDPTGQHPQRVAGIAARIAAMLGQPAGEIALLRAAALLHDIGKVEIPDAILFKPGRLTPTEAAIMQSHTTIGARILTEGGSPLLRMAHDIALGHHERWDGGGYPDGYAGMAIPLAARIVAVADVYDALTHVRPYRAAWPHDAALTEIRRARGGHFDPQVVGAFEQVLTHDGLATRVESAAPTLFAE